MRGLARGRAGAGFAATGSTCAPAAARSALPHALPCRPHQRPSGGAARVPERRARPACCWWVFPGRQRGPETGRGIGRGRAAADPGRLRGLHAARSGGLRAAPRPPRQPLYERRFVRRMRARLLATGRYRPADFAGLRLLCDIDDRITAPSFGFGTPATITGRNPPSATRWHPRPGRC